MSGPSGSSDFAGHGRARPKILALAASMSWRDWRSGELTTLLLALILAIAALTSVAFLAERIERGIELNARQMLGADLRVRSDQPLQADFARQAAALGLQLAQTTVFPSMASAADAAAGAATTSTTTPTTSSTTSPARSRLVAVKAVSGAYPLRGEVLIDARAGRGADAPGLLPSAQAAPGLPAPGTVWVDSQVLEALKLRVGDQLRLGESRLTIDAVITRELDRGLSFVNFAPRVMLNAADLPGTGLIGYGSRVTYRLLVAGPAPALAAFSRWSEGRIAGQHLRGVALESLADAQPQVRQTIERAGRFLRLVALLSALLAAVAIAMGAHRYARRHVDGCAVMRCLGVSSRVLLSVFAVEFVLVGLLGSGLGVALGAVGQGVMLTWIGRLVEVALPAPTVWPVLQGLGTGLILLLGFAAPPLLRLTRVPPARVLRRDWGQSERLIWPAYGVGVLLFAGLLIAAARELRLGLIVTGGFAAALLLTGLLAWLVLAGLGSGSSRLASAGSPLPFGIRHAFASLRRRGVTSALQITALTIGLMCLLLLSMTRNDLIAGWRKATPADAPNRFVIDIQPEQRAGVAHLLAENGLADAALAPMVRARLVSINQQPVDASRYAADADTRRLLEREFNLSYTTDLPGDNRIAAGRWFGQSAQPQMSVEAGLAKRLGLKLGDVLRFEVAGQGVSGPITSVRELDWGSMRVNFFVLLPPPTLADLPQSFITSFYLPMGRQTAIDRLIAAYPNLTVIDTGAILAQLQHVLDQVIAAVQFLFLFTLAAGILVLYAALAGSRDERVRDAALLRALGASARQIRTAHAAEFLVVGVLAGAMAALGAQSVGAVLARKVFDFPLQPNPGLWLIAIAAGVVCALLGGWFGLRRVLLRPPLEILRGV